MTEDSDPRVLFAAERTLLAWSRTSLGLIGFGFLVERSGLLINSMPNLGISKGGANATLWLGLLFMLLGAFSATFSSRQYLVVLRTIKATDAPGGYSTSWGVYMNGIVALLGLSLVAVLLLARC